MRKSSLGPRERGAILGQDSPRRPVSSLARCDSARTKLQVYRDDEELVTEEAEEKPVIEKSNSWIKSILGRNDTPAEEGAPTPSRAPVSGSSSSSKGKSRSIGRDILSKPARRGPTIEFDRDMEAGLSYSQEMLGEQERRKRRRIEGSGPAQWGKLEMCDAEDHEGFGSPRRERKNRQFASRPSQSGRVAAHRGPVISVGSDSSDGGEAELEADRKPLVARSQRQLDPGPRRLVPPSPRAPSPRKRSRQTPPASPAWLAPPTPSPSSSGSSAGGSTAAALQAQLVPPRRESSDRLEERHESSSRPAKTTELAVLVPNSDPPEPSLEDLDSGPEPSTLDSSSGSNEIAAETTPRKALPPPANSAPITAKRRGDDSGFSEGGVLMTSDDAATPRPRPSAAAAAFNSTRLDLTGLPTSSPTVPPLRRTLRPNAEIAAADDDEEQVGTSAQLGRTASGVLMPPPPLPVSPQKRLTRLKKGAPSSRAASLADKEAAAAAAAVAPSVDDDRSPPETVLEETQYLLPDGRSGLGDDPILVTDSYPFLFAPVPRPNPAKGYTPIRFGDQDDARLPTPHAKESPLTHKVPLLQPTTSSPIRAPVEAQDARVGPVLPTVKAEKVVTSVPAMGRATAAAAGWASSVAPAWEGARPPSPNAPRQSRLGEFFTTVPSSQAHADGREDEDDETQLVEDSQQVATGMAAEETALLRAVMQLRPRMNEMRAAATTTRRPSGTGVATVTGDLDDIVEEEHDVEEQQIESPSKPITPIKARLPSRASPSPSPSAYVEDSDPEGDALASPFVAGVLRSTSTSPTKQGRRRRSFGGGGGGGGGGRLDGPASVPSYSPTKIKRAAVERQARQRLTTSAVAEEEEPAAEGAATNETQWESYWSYPSEPIAGPSGAGASAAPAEGVLDCSPRKLAELIAKVKALPPDLPPDWAVDENGELYRIDEDRWDPDQYPITESLLHVLE
jgi:hypothetical protein